MLKTEITNLRPEVAANQSQLSGLNLYEILRVRLWLYVCMWMCAVALQIASAGRAHYHSKTPTISAKDSSISYSDSLHTNDSLTRAFAVAVALALPHTLSAKLLEILKNTERGKTYNAFELFKWDSSVMSHICKANITKVYFRQGFVIFVSVSELAGKGPVNFLSLMSEPHVCVYVCHGMCVCVYVCMCVCVCVT